MIELKTKPVKNLSSSEIAKHIEPILEMTIEKLPHRKQKPTSYRINEEDHYLDISYDQIEETLVNQLKENLSEYLQLSENETIHIGWSPQLIQIETNTELINLCILKNELNQYSKKRYVYLIYLRDLLGNYPKNCQKYNLHLRCANPK